ncbi:hypothetical protein D3871_29655 [Noviherbaspirillum saxi]|uniref:Uncharacterized protein n=2 Tax=Noviherbaspirillum saxi TaxID=2320863 RepID=A0A3A3G086_9BURK|nr:hypothetical protein D3871_29655 [Noviherbaspirillum saxi]
MPEAASAAGLQPAGSTMDDENAGIAEKVATPVERPDKPSLPDSKDTPAAPQSDKPLGKAAIELPPGTASDRLPEQGEALDLSAKSGKEVLAAMEGDNAIGIKNPASGQALPEGEVVENDITAPAATQNAAGTDAALSAKKAAVEPIGADAKSPSDIFKQVGDGQAGAAKGVKKPQIQDIPLQEILPAAAGPEGTVVAKASVLEALAPGISTAEVPADSVATPSEKPMKEMQDDAARSTMEAVNPAPPGAATLPPVPAMAKDADSALKEALRARLTDAASKEFV